MRQLLAYSQRHPFLALEHLLLLVVTLLYFKTPSCPAGTEACCCPSKTEGPLHVFDTLPGVAKAPVPTLNVATLRDGEVVSHHDKRGDIYRFRLGQDVVINMYKTVAGNKRSGDLHNCTQYNVIMKGSASLTLLDPVSGRDATRSVAENEFISIPARVPHLYEFPEDTYLLEWWGCAFEAWYYDPYRRRIST